MRQLTGLDAQFLAMETPSQYGHVGGLAILDPSTTESGALELADIQRLIAERLPLVPPFRWKLVGVPFDLDYPYWIDDPDFDLDFHVRELAIVQPYTQDKLTEQAARIFGRPLDRTRPLWEMYLIHGLPDGNVALLTKIHHAVVDGMSGNEILGAILDLSPEGRPAPERLANGGAGVRPSDLELIGRAALGFPRYPLRVLRALPSTLPNLEDTGALSTLPGVGLVSRVASKVQRMISGDPPQLGREKLTPPHTSFNGRVTPHRRIVIGQLSLEQVREVKNEHGCTVNDVIVSLVAGTVRRWLLAHSELPATPLVAQIPVSVRTDAQMGTFGNRILLMGAPLYTDIADPVARLLATHDSLMDMKARHKALPAELLTDANQFIPPAVFSRAARATFTVASSKRGRPLWNLVISNVPGPPVPLYCAGARLQANYPISVITDGMGLNITVLSYCGSLDFGIVGDREQMPDLATLMTGLEDELAALLPKSKAKPARAKAARAKPKSKVKRAAPAA